ncbi:family 1 extracellular solute-binding protein [Paenibacillus mucilaginosus 3016]|uniref:Family 1 extracellular solute-binding protein n=2 Tax=Paenibacillus mucilaginosus TaxID=61624 RepID=H6NAP7_9BACL|nr:extracellular solute-binding protein [Paenibacillus mucilaginosus]AFC30523.1 family 1 extracellular solute-binding protein [Paenibacillus mucilaginosus 3016]AFH61073.1 ABC transporter substrate-binding protein [Paenibacillus mucilaginosus K02]WFA19149.1 extracellular solute-binding protein [Paenibacillus mucilaginosus]
MKKNQGKKAALIALSSVLTATVMAGCSSDSAKEGGTAPQSGTSSSTSEYPRAFSYWVELDGDSAISMKSFSENAAYKEMEKITGTKVDFKHPTGGGTQVLEQFNLMVASRNLTDVIQTNWFNVARGPQNAIDEGTIIRLNDLIDKHAPNFKKYLAEHPEVASMIKTDKGDIYAFPFIRGDNKIKVYYGPVIRKDWLDKLGLEAPTTINEWEKVLVAFRDKDPNGNGKNDEIPFLLEVSTVRNDLLNAMIGAWGILDKFYQKDGKIYYGEMQPEFKDFLTTMQRWYKDGLIDKDFAAVDGKLKDAKTSNNQLGVLYGFSSGTIGKFTDLMKDTVPGFKMAALPHPTLREGDTPAAGMISPTYPGEHSVAITTAAKEPEKIVKWLDYAYGPEGHMLFNFGIKGQSYDIVNGKPAYTDTIKSDPNKLTFKQAQAQYMRSHYGGPFVQDVESFLQQMKYQEQFDSLEIWSKAKNQLQLPLMTLTADESKKLASIMNDINTFSDEMIVKFIMGTEPIDNFPQYVDKLKKFGIEEAIKIQQTAFDRYSKR